ncbi:hypothetical protein ASG67_01020 [Sphingomonas sp. Leaf339]|uniref:hypothetical protein n=1 Tax=Sphingomonas sp. Leaf339 TaxID=1736343 RepID=UPI0006FF777F|nr:hypothetical protein [Sphingomonas sp. Leaf339]KQU61795.1 hypothetical protein ASG67_01020 [Sphingomonas sp. Leaf339]
MDLTHSSFDGIVDIAALPEDLGTLMIDLSVRQEMSPTAIVQSGLVQAGLATGSLTAVAAVGGGLLAPTHGAFNPRVAARMSRWKDR